METTIAPPQRVEETDTGHVIVRLYLDCPSEYAKAVKTWLESIAHFHRPEKIIPTPSSASSSTAVPQLRIPTTILLPLSTSTAEARAALPPPPPESGLVERISVLLLPVSPMAEELGTEPRDSNPLSPIFRTFLSQPIVSAHVDSQVRETLFCTIPKRWTVYPPLVLLPTGSLSSDAWRGVLEHASPAVVDELWRCVLDAISRVGGENVTHLAINYPIPGNAEDENIIRAPSHLRALFGDFGPDISAERWAIGPGLAAGAAEEEPIGEKDFNEAFWVRTRQNGIFQSWSPRWTMFSRGNVTEKARVLRFGAASSWPSTVGAGDRGNEEEVQIAVDLYAGIGYFTLSYLSQGYAVLAWEINPFSIEGLRRGAVGNGFEVLVIKGVVDWGAVRSVVEKRGVVVFAEDNRGAWDRFHEGFQEIKGLTARMWKARHINLGLLPSSRMGWGVGGRFLGEGEGGWMHVHENIKEGGVEEKERGSEIVEVVRKVVRAKREEEVRRDVDAEVRNVAVVKGFGPGVRHVVFDVWVGPEGEGGDLP